MTIDLEQFRRDGYVIVRSTEILALKQGLRHAFDRTIRAVLAKEPLFADRLGELRSLSFTELIDHVVRTEPDTEISGRLYRVLATDPAFVAAIANPYALSLLSQLGLAAPLAGTLPILRIDRPGDTWHRTPAHQDWWFSLLSPNCVTCWFAISDLRPDMGLLEVVPGSHKGGLIPFCRNDNHNPFRPVEDYPDSAFQPVALPEDSMLVFSQYLLHRSGMNNSAQCRLSVQLRYNDIATMDRPDTTYTVQHPKHVLELQNRLLRPS